MKQNLPPVFIDFKRLWEFFHRVRGVFDGHGFQELDDAFAARDVAERIGSGKVGGRPWRRDLLAEAAALAKMHKEGGARMPGAEQEPRKYVTPGLEHRAPLTRT